MDLEELLKNREFEIGDTVYLQVADADPWLVFGYEVYSTHIEYLLRSAIGTMSIEGSSIDHSKLY